MAAQLEHANITVEDISAAIAFLRVIEPDLKVRRDDIAPAKFRWAHVALGASYIALQEPHVGSDPTYCGRRYKDFGVNHLGLVVDDLDAVIARLDAGGYRRGIPGEEHPHRRRVYYHDSSGMEWELVQYLSRHEEEMYSYE